MNKVLTHKRYADSSIHKISEWNTSEELKKAVLNYLGDYKGGDITNRIGSNIDSTIERQSQYLRPCFEWFGKNPINLEGIKLFKQDLLIGKIKSCKGKNYSLRVKRDMMSSFARFLDHYFKDNSPSRPLKVKIKLKKADPPALSLDEIDKLFKYCKTNEERYLIAVLMSGVRAEEFHNIRYSDISFVKGSSYVKLRVREEYSKTAGRTIDVYYKHTFSAVRDYLEENPGEPEQIIFKNNYDNTRKWLIRHGKKVLGKNTNFHLFRHSTATWLSNKMNRQQLCVYFGWSFSSPMPDIYIKRDGVEMSGVSKNIRNNELEEIQNSVQKDLLDKDLEIQKLRFDLLNVIDKLDKVLKKVGF